MPDVDQVKDQAQQAEQTAKDKAGSMDGLKAKLDVNGDGKTDADDVKSMADKVKGLLGKK